ncbi:hypothetical protein [Gimesia panareensis]|nr:hypothetical protein [Gimesia panareensis]
MALINLLNSDEFGYPCSWFEDSRGEQSTLMANRTGSAKSIPMDAQRIRIDGSIWVHGDEWLHQDIQTIHDRFSEYPEYFVQIVDDTLFIELAPTGRQ